MSLVQRALGALLVLVSAHTMLLADDPACRSADTASARPDVQPPINEFLAASPWPMTHGNPYNQDSSPLPGPSRRDEADMDFVRGEPIAVTLAVSAPYADGSHVIWGNTLQHVFKLDANSRQLDYYQRLSRPQPRQHGLSGAYAMIDRDNVYFVPRGAKIEGYRDAVAGDPRSAIVLDGAFTIPRDQRLDDREQIVGMNMTYDGYIVFVTSRGLVGVMGRDFQQRALLRLAEGKQEVSNSLAVDEEGGLFVITDSSLYRIQWDMAAEPLLSVTWSVRYESDGTRHVGRLGKGSGTTPTLVGVGDQQDKLVAICDDRRLMRLVLYWRNEIPADWPGLPGQDRRVAAEMPVRFGNADASRSTTEQSLVVRGYGIAVVSNRYGSFGPLAQWYIRRRLGEDLHAATIYKSNEPQIAPRGIEKLVWDPARRTLNTAWVNRTVSCPNGIPVMSDSSGLLYFIGQRDAQWTLEALDWQTGRSTFHRRLSSQPRYNSFFAGMLIGPGGSIFSGTYGGVLRFTP